MSELCPGKLGFIPSSVNFLRSDRHGRILKWTIAGKYVLVKKISLDTIHHEDKRSLHSHWEELAQLRDDHLLQYHLSDVQDDCIRYLVPMIDLCQGSMLDYCRKTLDKDIASYIKATDVMWQITCGLAYLQRHKIDQGRLKLKNVFFWKRNLKSKRVVVKLTGYGYNNYHKCEGKMDNIIPQLGCLFYSAATKEEAKPNEPISLHSLTEIEDNHKALALDLIRFLINGSISNGVEVSALFRHPLFTRCTDEGRSRLIQDSTGDNAGLIWNDKVKIQKWLESVDKKNFPEEDFDDFKDILLETENNDVAKIVSDAFKDTPQLFSEYIWHATIGSEEMRNTVREEKNKTHSIDKLEILGKGNYGEVYKCQYTDGNEKTYPAACKMATLIEGEDVFEREIEILRKLSHLFVVKYLDVVAKDSKKFIVMVLCDGSLKEYVEGKLELIPKDSLNEKILIGEVCLGLDYIHSQEIIHKDLKLENILLKRQPSGLVIAKIADFGFAKELKSGESEFSKTSHPGTVTYMAPELLNAKIGACPKAYPATFASDVYALGITIARIVLKGKHPFSNPDTNEMWCKISMIKGLVPQHLEGLSWDLIDLILKLTDKDPAKRPEMVLVLRHPYFVLTNEKTKEYFVDQLWADLDILEIFSKDYERDHLQNLFNGQNFREWYETIFKDKVETAEEKEEMAKTLQLLKHFGSGDQADTALKAAKQYEETIKKAIKSDHDTKSENRIDQMFPPKYSLTNVYFLTSGPLNKLIQRAPNLFVPYLWSHMQNSHSALMIISELEWSSLYYNDEKIIDELWNIKYSENYKKYTETIPEFINIVGKCNVSERIWAALLNEIDKNKDKNVAVDLIFSAVKSRSSSAPKATEMILQRYGITEEMATVINIAASNEGDWAVEIMQIILNYGGNPNAKMDESSCKGWTPVHYAAQNESRMGPKIMKLLLDTKRCDVNAQSIEKVAPIHLAANNKGDYAADILKFLIDNGAACDVIDERFSNFSEPIHYAFMNDDESSPKLVDLLLKKRGVNVIHKLNGMTLVHCAVLKKGDFGREIMKKLLENGAEPNIGDISKQTPLHYCQFIQNKEYQNIASMKILLQKGGDPNAINEMGDTPVHYAAANEGEQAFEMMELLLAHGGKLDIKNKNGFTPRQSALLNIKIRGLCGDSEKISNLPFNDSGKTLLHLMILTAEISKIEQIQALLDNGGNPNVVDNDGWSPVHYAVRRYQTSVGLDIIQLLTLLLQKDGDPNLPDTKFKATPVHFAAEDEGDRGDEKMKILLQNGGNSNAIDEMGNTPVHYAATNEGEQAFEMMELLLAHGGKLDIKNKIGFTPGHFALLNIGICGVKIRGLCGDSEKIVNLPLNDSGETLLHFMICQAETKIEQIQVLLDNGGNPNVVDNRGWSPVTCAVRRNQASVGLDIIQLLTLLLQKGGDPNLPDKKSKGTPVHFVAEGKGDREDEMMKILLENGGNANAVMEDGTTPLHLTAQNSGIHGPEVTRMLLEHGGNPNSVTNVYKNTPLHCAIIMETNINDQLRLNIIKQLLEKGGNPNARDVLGNTPVHYLVFGVPVRNSLEVLKLLLEHGGNILQKNNLGLTPHHIAQIGIEQYCNREVMKHILKTSREMIIAIYSICIANAAPIHE